MPATSRPLPPVVENGYEGMNADEVSPIPVGYVSLAQNVYFENKAIKTRPGFTSIGRPGTNLTIQAIAYFQELDGTRHTVVFGNGDLYEYNWDTNAWSHTDLSAKSISVDSGARIDWCVSRGRLIVTDGVHRPWMWNPAGANDAAKYVTLTEAPIADGCAVYYDRVFFYALPTSDSNVFEWSDVGDPTDGYSADNQDWEFAQTDTGAVTAMIPLNERMVVFKEDSISVMRGKVEDTFQTDAVREGVSETEGAPHRYGMTVVDGDVYYLSHDGPRILLGGYDLKHLSLDERRVDVLSALWEKHDTAQLDRAVAYFDKVRRHVVWLWPRTGSTVALSGFLYAVDEGAWSVIETAAGSAVVSASNAEQDTGQEHVLIGLSTGEVLKLDDSVATDGGNDITCIVNSRAYGDSIPSIQKRLSMVEWTAKMTDNGVNLKVYPVSERTVSTPESIKSNLAPGMHRLRRQFNKLGWLVGWQLKTEGKRWQLHNSTTTVTAPSRPGHG